MKAYRLESYETNAGVCRNCRKPIVLTDTPQTGAYYWHRDTQSVWCSPSPVTRAEPKVAR